MLEQFRKSGTSFVGLALLIATMVLAGCGGGGSTPQQSTGPDGTASTAAVQVNVGDDPCDRVAALVVNIDTVTLTNSSGGTASVLAAPTSVEFMHLLGSLQSLSLVNVPQDTYTKATISISSATATYESSTSGQMAQQTITGPWSVDVPFNPSLAIGSGSFALNLHLDVGRSVSYDSNGNAVFDPVFTAEMFHGGSSNNHNHRYGGLEHATGTVTSISGNSFVLKMMQSSQALTVYTNSSTRFDDRANAGSLAVGMIVVIQADMQADGTLLAREICLAEHDGNGMQADGLMVSVTGTPATQLTMIAHDGAGAGMSRDDMGGTIAVGLSSNTTFGIDAGDVDLTGLPFTPTFNSSNIFIGQSVEVTSSSGMGHDGSDGHGEMHHGTISSSTGITLEEQGLRGIVADYSAAGNQGKFTLTLASDSLFATLTGKTSIAVYQQASTELWGSKPPANGVTVEVHGLLFVNSGTYSLIASHIAVP